MNAMQKIIDKCIRSGAEMAEVFSLADKSMTIRVRNGEVEAIQKATPGGIAIRYFSYGKTAFAHTTEDPQSPRFDNVIDSLIAHLSKTIKDMGKDVQFTLPSDNNIPQNLDIYAPGHTDTTTDSKIEYLQSLEQLALKYDPLIKQSNGMSYDETISTVSIVNSNGLNVSYDTTAYRIAINVVAAKNDEMFPGEGDFSARYFEDLPEPEKMVEEVASKAVRLIGGTSVPSGDYEIIFTPEGAGSILWGLAFALDGESYAKGSSFLAGKIGSKFADSKLTVLGNPLMKRGIASRPVDAEGTLSQNLTLIESGKLNGVMYDLKAAAKADTKSTGSASRRDYTALPNIWPSNFHIAAGNARVDDVVSACTKGIIVEMTQGWGLNSINGQYSAGINGILIRNGKQIKPVANVTLASGTDELFNGIGAVCDDLTFYNNFNSPSIMIKKMKVGA